MRLDSLRRRRRAPSRGFRRALLASALFTLLPGGARAQLRPLDPLPWSIFEQAATADLRIGIERHDDVRASLAGVDGRLWELGTVRASWRTGRTAIEIAGTSLRVFEDGDVVAPPVAGTAPPDGERRVDAGDWRIATALRLTPPDAPLLAALRFGTRLPTTDNGVGLERDRIDFFATLGGRVARGALRVGAEAGVGIYGTRLERFEQSDVLVYALAASWRRGWLEPRVSMVGQVDGIDGTIRGNEDRGELRLGLRAGRRMWIEASAVTGLTRMGPDRGLRLVAGALLGGHDRPPPRVRPVDPPSGTGRR